MFCPDLSRFFSGQDFQNPAFSKKFGGTPIEMPIISLFTADFPAIYDFVNRRPSDDFFG